MRSSLSTSMSLLLLGSVFAMRGAGRAVKGSSVVRAGLTILRAHSGCCRCDLST
jgi:hypothetical protein